MDMRSLARCLRSRPIIQQPPSILRGQFVTRAQSTSDSPYTTNKGITPEQGQQLSNEYDQILNDLNFSNAQQNPQQTSQPPPSQPATTPNTTTPLSRVISSSASTTNYRAQNHRNANNPFANTNKNAMPDLKLGPSLGRTVHVDLERGFDLSQALRLMNGNCAANRIPQQVREQKYHVRRGQVRKNLRMLRWRKLFKFSFGETIKKIERMRAQGW